MMVLAIANPLCCCSADWLLVDDSVSQQMSSCCGGGEAAAADGAPVKQDHDPENCPHQASKEYQQTSSHEDVKLAHLDPSWLPVLFVLFEAYEADSHRATVSKLTESRVSAADPPSFSQVYCVYRI